MNDDKGKDRFSWEALDADMVDKGGELAGQGRIRLVFEFQPNQPPQTASERVIVF